MKPHADATRYEKNETINGTSYDSVDGPNAMSKPGNATGYSEKTSNN